MSSRDLQERIARRSRAAGVTCSPDHLVRLETYLRTLAKWNAKINLTSLKVEQPNDEAVDRLLIEAVVAAARVRREDRLVLDVGSGGGSPALPLKIAAPWVRMVLVESKVRKCAFLREAVRELQMEDVEVANCRFEELLSRTDLHEAVDVLTLRAVRVDRHLWNTMLAFVAKSGRVFLFGNQQPPTTTYTGTPFVPSEHVRLIQGRESWLTVLSKAGPRGSGLES